MYHYVLTSLNQLQERGGELQLGLGGWVSLLQDHSIEACKMPAGTALRLKDPVAVEWSQNVAENKETI